MTILDTAEPQRVRWDVPVEDATGRPRTLVVEVVETRVVIIPPPGGGFYLVANSIQLLEEALNAANSVADHRKRGYKGSAQ